MVEHARPRLNYTRVQRRPVAAEDSRFVSKTVRQFVICVVISALCFAVSKVDIPIFKDVTNSISSTLSYTIDYKATAKGLVEGIKRLLNLNTPPAEQASDESGAQSGEPADTQSAENTDEQTADTAGEEPADAATD